MAASVIVHPDRTHATRSPLRREDGVVVYFESADTQEKLRALLAAYENEGVTPEFMELAVEIDHGLTEATAGL